MKNAAKAAFIINLILTLVGIVCTAVEIRLYTGGVYVIKGFVNLCLFIVMIAYAVWGYKKPHGNTLKYLLLCYAAYLLFYVYIAFLEESPFLAVVYAAVVGAVSYVAGRLNKLRKNKYILMAGQIVMLITIVAGILRSDGTVVNAIYRLNTCILFSDVIGAYMFRFSAHRDAGARVPAEE